MFLNKNPKRGVALYTDKSLNAREFYFKEEFDFEEKVFCTFKAGNGEDVLVGCLYRSPNTNNRENGEKLAKLLKCEEIGKFTYVCIRGGG